jgi:phosphatidylethanolamine-binding protein (PEBP) family uncharacterized protein
LKPQDTEQQYLNLESFHLERALDKMNYIEHTLGTLLSRIRNHDSQVLTKSPAFTDIPTPTINLECPECGPSGSPMLRHHSDYGGENFPHLTWDNAPPGTVEYLLIVEDVDAPVPFPACHGLFYRIAASFKELKAEDFHMVEGEVKGKLSGGFYYGANAGWNHYAGPRGLLGHGPHRYVYQLVALNEKLNVSKLRGKVTKSAVEKAIVGTVGGYGVWVGTWEKVWGAS